MTKKPRQTKTEIIQVRITKQQHRPRAQADRCVRCRHKLRNSYMVDIRPNLEAWIDAYPFVGLKLSLRPLTVAIGALFRAAGVERIKNGWRHSFGTYLCALTDPRHAIEPMASLPRRPVEARFPTSLNA